MESPCLKVSVNWPRTSRGWWLGPVRDSVAGFRDGLLTSFLYIGGVRNDTDISVCANHDSIGGESLMEMVTTQGLIVGTCPRIAAMNMASRKL